jgi:hypothetical protein
VPKAGGSQRGSRSSDGAVDGRLELRRVVLGEVEGVGSSPETHDRCWVGCVWRLTGLSGRAFANDGLLSPSPSSVTGAGASGFAERRWPRIELHRDPSAGVVEA